MLVVLLCLVLGSEDGHSPTFWLLLYGCGPFLGPSCNTALVLRGPEKGL